MDCASKQEEGSVHEWKEGSAHAQGLSSFSAASISAHLIDSFGLLPLAISAVSTFNTRCCTRGSPHASSCSNGFSAAGLANSVGRSFSTVSTARRADSELLACEEL